jgi:ATP phosphoribosyltransferase
MAEAIVDLVSTGKTLKDNGLIEIEVLYQSTARFIGHPLSYRLYSDRFSELLSQMQVTV